MTLNIQKCIDESTGEKLYFIIIIDDNKKEITRIPFYSSKELDKQLPGLYSGLDDLYKLLEMIYESGKRKEDIKFIETESTL